MSDRQLGVRRPRLSLQDATGSSRRSFDSIVRQHRLHQHRLRPPFNPEEGKMSNRDVCRHFDRVDRRAVESSRFVSASTPVLHPFCKLTVIWLPRCPAVSIDRYSPIRHRNVRESLFPAPHAGARTLTVGLPPASYTRSRTLRDRRFHWWGRKSKESISNALSLYHCIMADFSVDSFARYTAIINPTVCYWSDCVAYAKKCMSIFNLLFINVSL